MSVASLSLFKIEPSYVEECLKLMSAIKDAGVALGAERIVSAQVTTGQYTGDWLVMTRAPDMATLDNIIRSIRENDNFKAIMASEKVSLVSRNYLDIPEGF